MAVGNSTDVSDASLNKMNYKCEDDQDKNTKVAHGGKKEHYDLNVRLLSERFKCSRCEKYFGHKQILQLHLRVHESNGDSQLKTSREEKEVMMGEIENSSRHLSKNSSYERLQSSPPSKKFIGLTKIRLEDCMRCDACSCIYLDESDYKKHMKNFHRQDSPKKHKQKKDCRSCCKHCNCRGNHQHHSMQKERGNNNLFHYNIKDRWSKMVSRRLSPEELRQDIKADPDDPAGIFDYSHLLSQVEVKIKTEPPEYEENLGQCE